MKIIFAALNAKFLHSCYALYKLKAACAGFNIEIKEYTINQQEEKIIEDIFRSAPSVAAFSCYIWNISMTRRIAAVLKKILPETKIVFGGPEVSFDPDSYLDVCDYVICGEGEVELPRLLSRLNDSPRIIYANEVDISALPFAYEGLEAFENRIIYYEAQRGCPFNCRYCLSGAAGSLRFLPLERVKRELDFFLERKPKQVKLVDRTFNCNKQFAMEIWHHLIKNDNGLTNFHFEIAGDLLDDDMLELLSNARQELFQFEIGVQSSNEETLAEIDRLTGLEKISASVKRLKSDDRINLHLDLIAGLPNEGLESFKRSFEFVYAMKPEQLQLGFLKLLKGSYLRDNAERYSMTYHLEAPYEILETKWLSYAELLIIKQAEAAVDEFYNSNRLINSFAFIDEFIGSSFEFFARLGEGGGLKAKSAVSFFTRFYEHCLSYSIEPKLLAEHMKMDLLINENVAELPDFMQAQKDKELVRRFYETYREKYDLKSEYRRTRVERFQLPETGYLLFDYRERAKNKGMRSFRAKTVDVTEDIYKIGGN